jgi:DNA polymerase III epsilon subunit-like protein
MSKSIIFDTETTGLDSEDRIIQVGAIIVDSKDKEYSDLHNELCSCEVPIKIEAMATHGIRESQLVGEGKFEDSRFFKVLKELNNESNYLIAHNLDFDLGMLTKYNFENKFSLIDTLQCAKHLFEINDIVGDYKVSNHKLQTFRYMLLTEEDEANEADKYGVEIKAHDAIGDVVILKLFLKKLVERLMSKYKLKKYSEIMEKLVFLTKEPVEVKFINFGKHKGKAITEIESIDSGWINWLFKEQEKQKNSNDSKFNRELYNTLDKVIKKRNSQTGHSAGDGLQF